MSTHTPECGGARRFEIKSELEKRLSQLNLEALDSSRGRLSSHTQACEHRPGHRPQAAEAPPVEHVPASSPPSGSDRAVYKSNVMLIIDAAKKVRNACKTNENYLIEAATNIITSTTMFSQK